MRRSLSESGEPWKACWATASKLSNSSSVIGQIGYGPSADSVMVPSYLGLPGQRDWFSRSGPHRIQCPHHGYRVAAQRTPPRAATRAAVHEDPAYPADQAVHHQEPSASLRFLGTDDRDRGGLGAP